ncbi:MAG: hypothetical protein U5R30_14445 [Deltaproteobacteria bacterium]|nr:hypothetical protein [Deltaproteobacteria bacterium]
MSDLFDQTEFRQFVLKRAKDSDFVGSMMDDLTEPPPPNAGEAIPFLGETKIYEFVLDIAAAGDLVLNVGGTWIGRRSEDATNEDALRYIRGKAFRTGQEMRQIQLGLPGAVGGGTVTVPNVPSGGRNTRQESVGIVYPGPTGGNGTPLSHRLLTGEAELSMKSGERGGNAGNRRDHPSDLLPRQSRAKNPKNPQPGSTCPAVLKRGECQPAKPSKQPESSFPG